MWYAKRGAEWHAKPSRHGVRLDASGDARWHYGALLPGVLGSAGTGTGTHLSAGAATVTGRGVAFYDRYQMGLCLSHTQHAALSVSVACGLAAEPIVIVLCCLRFSPSLSLALVEWQ